MNRLPDTLLDDLNGFACPSALTIRQARIDTCTQHQAHVIYEADAAYFRVHSTVRVLLREAITGEFDESPSSNPFAAEPYPPLRFQEAALPSDLIASIADAIPRLWVLCTQLAPGVHQITTLYRGNPLWEVREEDGREIAFFRSENEIIAALSEIQQREGVDQSAMDNFMCRYFEAHMNASLRVAPNDKKVH